MIPSTFSVRVLGTLLVGLAAVAAPQTVAATTVAPGNLRAHLQSTPSDSTTFGVVWTPPDRTASAVRTLERIAAINAGAVRLPTPPSDTLAARAASLGVALFIDLPVSHRSAGALDDALTEAAPTLDRIVTLAEQYPSVTHVGLARAADTTVPRTCEVLATWTDRIHDRSPSLQTYYVTPFPPAADRCASAVDRPLVDLRTAPDPVTRWEKWSETTVQAGIGAVGTWMNPSTPPGIRNPHSPESQARHLERALTGLLDSTQASPPILFVSRWRDRAEPLLPSRRYGLHDREGTARPAARVIRGFFSGRQRTFAFPSGTSPGGGPYGLLFLNWGLVILLGATYAQSLFIRRTLSRYFRAHGFYRDAVRELTAQHAGLNVLLLGIITVAVGATATVGAHLAAAHPAAEHVLRALPPGIRGTMAAGIARPSLLGLVAGAGILAVLLLWTAALVVVARQHIDFTFGQGLMVVVWPCWPVLAALPVALATGPDAPISPSAFAILLLVGTAGTVGYVTGRVLTDYRAVTNLPFPQMLPLAVLSPLVLTAAGMLLLTLRYDVPFLFLWRLATFTA